ncbi:MAG: ABC transporter permease [Anaerolineaceae bacterium]|nr:MAG: ABC transporter permease [Anaerolineaceae bacterium]
MVFQLYKSRLKCLFRNKENIFWSYVFPIALATLYYFAFTNLFSSNDLDTINIAYVEDVHAHSVHAHSVQDENTMDPLKDVLEAAEISEELPLFNVRYYNIEEASNALEEDEIIAYIVSGVEPKVYVNRNGLSQTIVKSFMDSYNRAAYTIQSILIKQPDALNHGLLDDVMDYKSFTTEVKNGVKPDVILVYYYALMAFCCLLAANWGLDEVVNIQGNRSNRGARINVSPIHKMKLLLINMLAAFTAHAGSIVLMLLYMIKVLDINFGDNLPQLILACFIGDIIGLFIGATIGAWVNKSSSVQGAISTSIVMVGSFLSGMMFVDMKYLIAKNAPILSYINPVNLVSDSFYSLYYYDNFERFYMNITILVIMAVVLGVASYLGLRRKTYASI